jgi:hypothetical protein
MSLRVEEINKTERSTRQKKALCETQERNLKAKDHFEEMCYKGETLISTSEVESLRNFKT